MKNKYNIHFVTIVPSPYQRDLFAALAAREDVDLRVHYMERASPDSPWPEKPLRAYEHVMPSFWFSLGDARVHVNWPLPEFDGADMVVISTYASMTGQLLMRRNLRKTKWVFWGERLQQRQGIREVARRALIAPFSGASAIVGIGSLAELDYQRRFPNVPHFNIPYHCELAPFFAIKRSQMSAEPITFLFCGQMIHRKGVDLLLQAFDALVRDGLDARLRLVGREAALPELMGTVGPSARSKIIYEGFQAPEHLAEFFARSDVFILPSRHDGWGVVVNQALAAGLPVIASHAVGAGVDLVENGVNGLSVAAGDAKGLYEAMKRLAERPEIAREWGENARAKAIDLTPDVGAEKWVRVLASTLG